MKKFFVVILLAIMLSFAMPVHASGNFDQCWRAEQNGKVGKLCFSFQPTTNMVSKTYPILSWFCFEYWKNTKQECSYGWLPDYLTITVPINYTPTFNPIKHCSDYRKKEGLCK